MMKIEQELWGMAILILCTRCLLFIFMCLYIASKHMLFLYSNVSLIVNIQATLYLKDSLTRNILR